MPAEDHHTGALIEDLTDQVRLVAEGVAALHQEVGSMKTTLFTVCEDVALLKLQVGRLVENGAAKKRATKRTPRR